MVDVARLQVEVDSRPIKKGKDELDRFSRSGKKAENSSKGFGDQAKRTARAMQGMNRSVKLLTGAMGALTAAFSIRAIQQFTMSAINAADQIGKLSATAGVTAESLQELRFAFGQLAGTTDAEVDASLRRFNRRLGLAVDGAGPAAKAFEDMGIALLDTSGQMRSTELVLDDTMAALAGIENDARRAAVASQVFGDDAGPRLAAALGEGETAVQDLRQEAQRLGIVLGDDAVENAEALSDQLDILNKTIRVNFQEGLMTGLAGDTESFSAAIADPQFQEGIETLGNFIGESIGFLVENADTIIKAGQALALIGLSAKLGGTIGGRRGAIAGAGAGAALFALSQAVADAEQQSRTIRQTGASQVSEPQLITGPQRLPMIDLTRELENTNRLLDQAEEKTSIWMEALKDVKSVMEQDLSDSITDVIMQVESLSDAFKNLAQQIARTIIQRQIADPLAQSIISGIGGLFPSSSGTFSASVSGFSGSGLQAVQGGSLSMLPGRANGGNVYGNTPYMVGERGPEMFVPSQDGRILSNDKMGTGNVTVNVINEGGQPISVSRQNVRKSVNGDTNIDVMVKQSIDRLDSQGQLDGMFRRHGGTRTGQF